MSSLDNLTAKILQDAESRAEDMLQNTRAEAERLLAHEQADANAQRDRLLTQARGDAELSRSQAVNGEALRLRDRKLSAKQETIERVFQAALDRLNANSDASAYQHFLESYLVDAAISGDEEVVFPAQFKNADLLAVNEKRAAAGMPGNLKPAKGGMEITGGFVLVKQGARNKFTYEALLDFYRDDLEREIVNTLF